MTENKPKKAGPTRLHMPIRFCNLPCCLLHSAALRGFVECIHVCCISRGMIGKEAPLLLCHGR